jgi:hypothetical protein
MMVFEDESVGKTLEPTNKSKNDRKKKKEKKEEEEKE